jgi:hypothetical protein
MKRWTIIGLSIVAIFGLSADSCGPNKNSSAQKSQRTTEAYQDKLTAAVPYPLDAMKDSVERRNLRERLLRFNKPDKIGYVYLLSNTGSVIAFYTIKGKISSTQSQLTNADSTECHNGCSSPVLRQAPGDDGSYGPNEPGIFFFTTEDVLVQWDGQFIYADAPLKISSVPLIVETPGAKPSSTSANP